MTTDTAEPLELQQATAPANWTFSATPDGAGQMSGIVDSSFVMIMVTTATPSSTTYLQVSMNQTTWIDVPNNLPFTFPPISPIYWQLNAPAGGGVTLSINVP